MTTLGSKLGAAILGGLLSLPAFHAMAACNAGDLAGAWSMYASMYVKPANVQPTVMRCNVTLSNASSSPIKYNISGPCVNYQTSADVPISVQVTGNASLVENATTCKLTGTFRLSGVTVTVLEARVEGDTPKRHISGIARIFMGSDTYTLLDFRLLR